MALHEIIYVSRACEPQGSRELLGLLDQSRSNNLRTGITGFLLYHQQEFLQLIEGEQGAVMGLYERICRDQRHQQIHLLWSHAIEAPSFPDWSMGFVAPDGLDVGSRPGYHSLRSGRLCTSRRDNIGKKLLLRLRDDLLATPCTG